ncbi:MAG: ester cyclase [Anaerolineae bacterium]
MSVKENKATIRRFWDQVFNERDLDLIDELFTADWAYHGAGGQELKDPEELKGFLSMYFNAFPDMHATVEDVIAEDDRVVSRATGRGTHEGELMGVAPTGKQIEVMVICITRFEDGKIAEDWELVDLFGMMQQLGVISPPGQPGE